MKTITKTFTSRKAAERFLDSLYAEYDHVRLVSAPRYSESGYYTWEVK